MGDTALPTSSGDWRRSGSSEAPAPSQRAVNEPLLTSWIRDAGRLEDLERLVQQHGSSMVALHVAAAYTRLGKLPGRGPAKHILADRLLLQLLPPLLPALTVRQCDNIMGTMARMQHCHRGTLIALLGQLLGQLPAAEACNVASVLWSLAKLSRSTHSIEAAVEAAVTHHAAALSSLLRHLVSEDVLAAARPQDCAMALWALATLASSWSAAALAAVQIALQDEPGTVSRLLGRLTSRLVLAAANAQEASNATWALGKLAGSSATAAVAAVEAAVTQHAGALGSLLGYVTSRGILGVANPQDIANVLWALATLGSSSSPAAVAAMEGAVGQQAGAVSSLLGRLVSRDVLAAANPQDAGNVMWALATLGVSSSPAAVAAMRAALSQHGDALTSLLGRLISSAVLPAVKPQEAANVLWALAKLGSGSCAAAVAAVQAAMMQHASAVSAMLGRVVQKGRHSTPATPQGLATAIWSLAVLSDADTSPRDHLLQQHGQSGYSHLWQLLGALAQAVPSMGPQDVANSIWAASKLRVSSEGFAGAMQDAAAQQRRHMLPQQLASAALGAAVLAWGEPSAALVASMLQEAARRVRQQGAEAAGFLHQGLANLCVSVPVAQMPPSPQLLQQLRVLCDALAQHWDAPLNGDVLRREHPPQLLQLHMWLQASGSQQGTDAQPLLPEQLLQECEAAWFRQHSHITESSFEREVGARCGVSWGAGLLRLVGQLPCSDGRAVRAGAGWVRREAAA